MGGVEKKKRERRKKKTTDCPQNEGTEREREG